MLPIKRFGLELERTGCFRKKFEQKGKIE